MLNRSTAGTVVHCSKCDGGAFCDYCNDRYKTPWRRDFPLRYQDAKLQNVTSLTKAQLATIYNFEQTIFNKNHTDNTGLYIYGNLGIGKTYLLYAIANDMINKLDLRNNTSCPAAVVDSKELIYEFHGCYTGRYEDTVQQHVQEFVRFARNGAVMIDDLGHGNTTKEEFATNILNLLLDSIYSNKGFMAFTANHSPKELKNYLGSYAVDRVLDMCKENVIELTGKSQRLI